MPVALRARRLSRTLNPLVLTRSKSKILSPSPLPTRHACESPIKNDTLSCWVDATPNRVAILVGQEYRTFKTKQRYNPGAMEAAAIELGINELAHRRYTGKVVIYSDNTTAIETLKGGKCKLKDVVDSATRTRDMIKLEKLQITAVYVPGKQNPADPLSRGRNPLGHGLIQRPAEIPKALRDRVDAE